MCVSSIAGFFSQRVWHQIFLGVLRILVLPEGVSLGDLLRRTRRKGEAAQPGNSFDRTVDALEKKNPGNKERQHAVRMNDEYYWL